MFISIRITPKFCELKNDPDNEKFRLLSWVNNLRIHLKSENEMCLVGFENLDKKGRETHPHYHINLYCEDIVKKDTLAKWMRNNFNISGKQAYCLQVFGDVDDELRWWRYCCKEKLIFQNGFKSDEIKEMTLLAKDERKNQIQSNLKLEAKIEDKNCFREKLISHFKEYYKEVTDQPTYKELWLEVAAYYRNKSKTPNFDGLKNIVIDVQLSLGLLTLEEVFNLKH